MKILGIDTATSTAGIAIVDGPGLPPDSSAAEWQRGLIDGRGVLAEARHDTSGRGADLLVAIDALCRAAGVTPMQLEAVAIGAGPGSFTGLRIGMATAKGIAFAANRPLWAVSSLAALADDAARELAGRAAGDADLASVDEPIAAVLDARRGEVFAGVFVRGAAIAPERVMAPGELAPWVAAVVAAHIPSVSRTWFAGDAIEAHRDALAPLAAPSPEPGAPSRWLAARTPSGRAVARLALAGAHVDITRGGAPVYIRPSEAEVMYPDGVPGALRRR